MGYGGYDFEAHEALVATRANLPSQAVFTQRECHPLMQPRGVKVRESRDSAEHPDSLPIVFALDVTGSMGAIPEALARRELPGFVKLLRDQGLPDPQVLFLAVGDAYHDVAPLQVGQFESTAEAMDRWLTWSFLEGRGGPLGQESYELALYFAARHTDTDRHRIRGRRGYLFVTGDEEPYPVLTRALVRGVLGDDLDDDLPLGVVVDEVSRVYDPFVLVPDAASARRCEGAWRRVLGDQVLVLDAGEDACRVAAGVVALGEGRCADLDAYARTLVERGTPRERVGAVVRALTPWAAALDRDGGLRPALDATAALPTGDAAAGAYVRPPAP